MLSGAEKETHGKAVRRKCLQLKKELEANGVRVEVDLSTRKMAPRIDHLMNRLHAKKVVVIGTEELESGRYTVKRDNEGDLMVGGD